LEILNTIWGSITMDGEYCLDARPLRGKLHDFQPLEIAIVNKTMLESTWDYMVKNYHYLGYEAMIGPRIKYLVTFKGMPIAALSYNRASLTVGVRDRYIGWNQDQKREYLKHLVNNNRFLILPWIRIKNLASYLLSRTLKMVKTDWKTLFGIQPYLAETFVDCEKYKGICYQAANWTFLGETKGFAKVGKTFVYHGNRKGVYIYPINKEFISDIKSSPQRQTLKKVCKRVPNMMLHKPDWSPYILEEAGVTPEAIGCLGDLLDEYLSVFGEYYIRSEQRIHGECYVKGLLSDLERKSIEPIAIRYEGIDAVRGMQKFSKHGQWEDDKMHMAYKYRLSSAISMPDGMINTDECDFPKKGTESVGVARQYCGILGKTDNCQAGIFIGYSSSKGYGLIDRQLYMPEKWFSEDYAERRKNCEVPEGLTFKTKTQMASEMIKSAIDSELVPAKWVGADSSFGNDKAFLDGLPEGVNYFADIHATTVVFKEMPVMTAPEYSGKGRKDLKPKPSTSPVAVSAIAADENLPWSKIILAEGAKGPIITDIKCLRVVECRDHNPGNVIWLYIRRYENGRIKYSLCNAPFDTPIWELHRAATMRWPIEQCFEECKSELGMDHCESRSWNSWHRHTFFVLLAHLFIQELRLRFKKNTYSDIPTS
jgi:SRSO17 transposase